MVTTASWYIFVEMKCGAFVKTAIGIVLYICSNCVLPVYFFKAGYTNNTLQFVNMTESVPVVMKSFNLL